MATGDLTNISDLKLWLPIPAGTTSEDPLFSRLITATSNDFVRAIKRPDLLAAAYSEVRQGDGANRMILYHWPINSIATLTIAGAAVTASADKVAPGYYFDQDIDPERMWNLYLVGQTFTDAATVAISYNAGYATIPADIAQAVIDWVVYRYKGRPNVDTTRRSQQGESVQIEQVDAPGSVLSVIDRYTKTLPCLDRRNEERDERIQRGFNRAVPRGSNAG